MGGPIGLIETGDGIVIDAVAMTIDLRVSDSELEQRRSRWEAPQPRATRGLLAKYAKLVGSASAGAVTD